MHDDQFELEGVTFGNYSPVDIAEWRPGGAEVRSDDQPRPTGDGVRMNKDYRGIETWGFDLFTNLEDERQAWAELARLKEAWDADNVRLEPGAVQQLRYRLAGEERCVFGRGNRWSMPIGNSRLSGKVDAVVDFRITYPLYFDAAPQSEEIPLAAPFEADAGFVFPFTFPVTFEAGAHVRQSEVLVGGEAPTPITLTFDGPLLGGSVQIGPWKIALLDDVVKDDPVTVDGRPWVAAATRKSGGGVRLAPRVSKISKMWLPPGRHQVIFTGQDPTNTATVTVSWLNARRLPR